MKILLELLAFQSEDIRCRNNVQDLVKNVIVLALLGTHETLCSKQVELVI